LENIVNRVRADVLFGDPLRGELNGGSDVEVG